MSKPLLAPLLEDVLEDDFTLGQISLLAGIILNHVCLHLFAHTDIIVCSGSTLS